jgi:Ribbon-helix-helix protein, copG family.
MRKKQVEILDCDYPLQRVSFEIDPRAVSEIDEIADEKRVSRSEIFRQIIYLGLTIEKGKKHIENIK